MTIVDMRYNPLDLTLARPLNKWIKRSHGCLDSMLVFVPSIPGSNPGGFGIFFALYD